MRLVHLNLAVHDVERAIAFYRRWFGFTGERRTYPDGTSFVSDAEGFDLALHRGAPANPPAPAIHFGFRCETADEVRDLRRQLTAAGVQVNEAYEADGYVNLKCADPDGYEIEVYWEASIAPHRSP